MRVLRLGFVVALLTVSAANILSAQHPSSVVTATCQFNCGQAAQACRNFCFNRGPYTCGSVIECSDPCTYSCRCENIDTGNPC